ncbi:MAG: MaoC family dehydratase [Rhodobacteraceae bacterium]|nr:MaoC family dehydratase [Paracoccaceae bacterium]MBR9822854.1 MaoC family dehydratase [Paracoccaceae bacterium]
MQTTELSPALSRAALEACLGQEVARSPWVEIRQDRIDHFAEITEDHQFIHTDPARAAAGPFGTPIAHGFLTLSLLSGLLEKSGFQLDGAAICVNYGFDRLRFLSPVPVGSRVRAHFTLARLTPQPGALDTCLDVTLRIEGQEKPALAAQWILRHYLGESA